MQLVLSNNRIIAHGENFLSMGGVVINTETGARYENATIAECEGGCPSDINEVGYEYHAGVFVPCAPYGKAPRNSKLVVACESCATLRTNDTKTSELVTLQTLPFSKTHERGYYPIVDMAVGDGLIAYAGGTMEISTDGFNWQALGVHGTERKVAVGNGIIAYIEKDNGVVYYSNDKGVTWGNTSLPELNTSNIYSKVNLRDIAFGNGIFVAIERVGTYDGEYLTAHCSADCVNWESSVITGNVNYGYNVSLEFFEGRFYVTKLTARFYSDNGLSWVEGGSGLPTSCSAYAPSMAMGNGKLITICQTDEESTYFSGCGVLPAVYKSIAFGNGVFVAVGTGIFAYSLDNGTTWATGEMPESVPYEKVIYTGDMFLAAHSDSNSTNIAYSTNGISWTIGGLNLVTADKEIITGQVKAILGIGNTEIVYDELAAAYKEGVQEA